MRKIISIKTEKLFTNITTEVENLALEWGLDGIVNIFQKHTTSAVRILEDELLHLTDVRFFLDKNVPKWKEPEGDQKNIKYLHDLISLRQDVPTDERTNGYSHIRSLYFNSSETIPVDNGKLMIGDWQDIFFIELDSGDKKYPLREREIIITFMEFQ